MASHNTKKPLNSHIHRIDCDYSVKVADFGLTRDIYQKEYYRQRSTGQVPVKWMAPESLMDRISNEKTDVVGYTAPDHNRVSYSIVCLSIMVQWSFGVTCWEVFSLGCVPYPTIANSEVVDYLMNGHRLSKPALCKDSM